MNIKNYTDSIVRTTENEVIIKKIFEIIEKKIEENETRNRIISILIKYIITQNNNKRI